MWFRNLVIHIHHYSNKEKVGMHAYFRLALVSPAADGNSQSLINTGGGGEVVYEQIDFSPFQRYQPYQSRAGVSLLYYASGNGLANLLQVKTTESDKNKLLL